MDRTELAAWVVDHWPTLAAQGWQSPSKCRGFYEKHSDDLELDLVGVAYAEKLAAEAENAATAETRPKASTQSDEVSAWLLKADQIKRMYADGMGLKEIQWRVEAPDGEQISKATLEKLLFGTPTPSDRFLQRQPRNKDRHRDGPEE